MVCYRLAINRPKHKRALSALSRTDSLTGLLNHGAWKDLLQLQFQRCRAHQQPAAIALIDIDHFKSINDTYGHIVGDSVLRVERRTSNATFATAIWPGAMVGMNSA